jgi:hypothetical protein
VFRRFGIFSVYQRKLRFLAVPGSNPRGGLTATFDRVIVVFILPAQLRRASTVILFWPICKSGRIGAVLQSNSRSRHTQFLPTFDARFNAECLNSNWIMNSSQAAAWQNGQKSVLPTNYAIEIIRLIWIGSDHLSSLALDRRTEILRTALGAMEKITP